ncbi:DUF3472 domain-containing protein [Olivibacter sp. XZL3]|uniref:DUF3472 domain-containing protein n=1 Tax=Olivibacter sp. XZL3 TaxID=1735116 RepID=UPI0010654C08|nr:DUF3472 domain-containing protein [Olivibacter sp. XZL3]
MQRIRIMLLFGGLLIAGNEGVGQVKRNDMPADLVKVPIAGNSWQTGDSDGQDLISEKGVKRWDDVDKGFKTYVRVGRAGTLSVWLNALVDEPSRLTATIAGITKEVNLPTKGDTMFHLGNWHIRDTGYLSIDLKGKPVHLTDIAFLGLTGTAVSERTHFVKNNEGNFFYWGRRGPSTHLNYQVPEEKDIAYYYNEVTVPAGNDVVGSYFMADGFTGGYFGMQVNSSTERRILFSVWSPFQTDDPKAIPPDHQIKLIKKGEGVHTGEFGNEGAGGQSYFKFAWKAGATYKFLLKGEPVENNYTNYTAWFFAPEVGQWKLIASFSRPQTSSWLKGFHSFLENFSPRQGIYERKVYFGNQWVCDREGNWYEIDKARFSADNTARVGYRMDYSGGSEQKKFFLRNFGFFNDYTPIGTVFHRTTGGVKPTIEFNELP